MSPHLSISPDSGSYPPRGHENHAQRAETRHVGSVVPGSARNAEGLKCRRRLANGIRQPICRGIGAARESTLKDKAELAGIDVAFVGYRDISSTCPSCKLGVPKPRAATALGGTADSQAPATSSGPSTSPPATKAAGQAFSFPKTSRTVEAAPT